MMLGCRALGVLWDSFGNHFDFQDYGDFRLPMSKEPRIPWRPAATSCGLKISGHGISLSTNTLPTL